MDDPLVHALVEKVRARLDQTVAASVERTWEQVPAYAASPDGGLREDVRAHVDAVFRAVLTTMEEGRQAVVTDFPITADQAARRVRQGISLADFLRAFRVNQVRLWESVLAAATDRRSKDVALGLATQVMQVIEVGSSIAAESYLAAQQAQLIEGDRLRRDLVEDVLAGRDLTPGPKADLARALGLEPSSSVLVVSAVAADATAAPRLRDAMTAVSGVLGATQGGVAVLRQDEMVALAISGKGTVSRIITGVEKIQRRLEREGFGLVVGLSTSHDNLASAPRAYAEAILARDALQGTPGLLALPTMKTFDYLLLRDDPTLRRLVRPELRRFVEDDQARGGTLIDTFRAYVDSNLNAKETAATMHLHPNSAYYRLERIGERTGLDLRAFSDVLELAIAISVLAGSEVPRS